MAEIPLREAGKFDLTPEEINKHKCFHVEKGHRKGKWCSLLVKV